MGAYGKLGTGFNLNGLVTPEAEFYRNQFQNFNLSVKFIGVEKSKAFFLQAIHRYVRLIILSKLN